MWIASMLAAINSVVAQVVTGYHRIYYNGISLTMTFILVISFEGYQANVIQPGLHYSRIMHPATLVRNSKSCPHLSMHTYYPRSEGGCFMPHFGGLPFKKRRLASASNIGSGK